MNKAMEYQFKCGCGAEVSDFTRGGDIEISTSAICEQCGTVYALTITRLQAKYD